MPFKKGNKGRPKGAENKVTKAFKEAVLTAFHDCGGVPALTVWANENRTEFYKIAARLIPHEVTGANGGPVSIATKVVHEYHGA